MLETTLHYLNIANDGWKMTSYM